MMVLNSVRLHYLNKLVNTNKKRNITFASCLLIPDWLIEYNDLYQNQHSKCQVGAQNVFVTSNYGT